MTYTLKLGSMYLAPRSSIFVLEPIDFDDVTFGLLCNEVKERHIVFTLYIKSDTLLEQIEELLASGCGNGLTLYRNFSCETTFNVVGGYIRRIQPRLEYAQCGYTLAVELNLTLAAVASVTAPMIMHVAMPMPTVLLDPSQSPSAMPLAMTLPTPGVDLGIPQSALALTLTIPALGVAFAYTPSVLSLLMTLPMATAVLGGGDVPVDMGTYAARPAAGTSGKLYLATDSPILSYDDGAAWTEFYGTYKLTNDTFPSTWINQGGASSVTTYGAVQMIAPASAGFNVRILKKAAPATPYTITTIIFPHMLIVDNHACGLVFRQSSDGKLSLLRIAAATGVLYLAVTTLSSPSVAVANQLLVPVHTQTPIFLRIADDGVNRISSWSMDGNTWVQLLSEPRTTYLTADEVGMFVESANATYDLTCWFLSWDEA